LNDYGIPGLQYLDGGSRRKGEGSHNYVIWDEGAVEVAETYYQRSGTMGGMSEEDGGVVVTGHEFGDFDFSEPGSEKFKSELVRLRITAKEFYENDLEKRPASHPQIGEIRFAGKGRKKTFKNSANYKKLLAFAKLRELIQGAAVIKEEENRDRKKHPNIDKFVTLQSTAMIMGTPEVVTMTVYQDNRGNFYYNHGLFKGNEKSPVWTRALEPDQDRELRDTSSTEDVNDIITDQGDNLNIKEKSGTPLATPEAFLSRGQAGNAPDIADNIPQNGDNLNTETAGRPGEGGPFSQGGETLYQPGDAIQRAEETIAGLENELALVKNMIADIENGRVDSGKRRYPSTEAEDYNFVSNVMDEMRALQRKQAELETGLAYEKRGLAAARKTVAEHDKALLGVARGERKEAAWRRAFMARERYKDRAAQTRERYKDRMALVREKERVGKMIRRILKAATSKSVYAAHRLEIIDMLSEEGFAKSTRPKKVLRSLIDADPDIWGDTPEADRQDVDGMTLDKMMPLTIKKLEDIHSRAMKTAAEGRARLREIQAERAERRDAIRSRALDAQRRINKKAYKEGIIRKAGDVKDKQYGRLLGRIAKMKDSGFAATLRPDNLVDWIEDGRGRHGGPLRDLMITQSRRARDEYLENSNSRIENLEKGFRELGLAPADFAKTRVVDGHEMRVDELMHVYAGLKNEKSAAILRGPNSNFHAVGNQAAIDKFVDDCAAALTADEKAAADLIAADFEQNSDRLAKVLMEELNRILYKEDFYTGQIGRVDHRRNPDKGAEAGGRRAGNIDEVSSNAIDTGWSKRRVTMSPEMQPAMRLGLYETALESIKTQEHFIAYARLTRDQQAILSRRPSKEEVSSGKSGLYDSLENLIRQNWGADAWKALDGYRRLYVTPDAVIADSMLSGTASAFAKGGSVTYLCYSLGTMIRNFSSVFRAISAVKNPVYLLKACAELAWRRDEMLAEVYALDPQMKNRKGNPMIEALKTLRRESKGNRALDAAGRASDKFESAGFAPMEYTDRWIAAVTWKATYYQETAGGKSHGEARDAAQDAVLSLMQPASVYEMPALWRESGLARIATLFTTDLAQEWNMKVYDLPQAIRRGDLGQALATLTALTLSAFFVHWLREGPPPDDDEGFLNWWRDFFVKRNLDSVPLFGKGLTAAYEWAAYGRAQPVTDFLSDPFSKAGRGARRAFLDDNKENDAAGLWDIAEGGSILAPLLGLPAFPVTAARRLWDAAGKAQDGEAWQGVARGLVGMRAKKEMKKRKARMPARSF
jgi:hypothetical protein